MNHRPFFCRLATLLALAAGCGTVIPQEEPPQPLMTITAGPAGWDVEWEGVAHRVYFLQYSFTLSQFFVAPLMEFGLGTKEHGCSSTHPKFFLRLDYYDDPEIRNLAEAELASRSGDGLPNAWKVSNGFPTATAATGDDFITYLAGQPAPPVTFELHTPLQ